MNRILYLSLVDWNWIKQRPQIMAEELSETNIVYCLFPKYYKKKELANNINTKKNLVLIPRIKVPFSGRNSFFKKIDRILAHAYLIFTVLRYKPNIIYASYPYDYTIIMKYLNVKIVYDCMDNYSEFEHDNKEKRKILNAEKKLIDVSDAVFVSSAFLRDKITKEYNADKEKVVLVRNGYSGPIKSFENNSNKNYINTNNKIKIAYIGTVSEWFDYDALEKVLTERNDVEIHIIGPVNINKRYFDNLFYDGVVEHDELYTKIKDFDCLIMPFKINKIIEAVDPVKLYEYINFNKEIITVYYDEINRFKEFVWFYSNYEELLDSIEKIKNGSKKYTVSQRIQFLKENDWHERKLIIERQIESLW